MAATRSPRILFCMALLASYSAQSEEAVTVVPVDREPLHEVRYNSDKFTIYTNWIEAGQQTLYHQHHRDLLSLLPADLSVETQVLGESVNVQSAPAGGFVFFPYADLPEPYVHRLKALEPGPFINIGLEFAASGDKECVDGGASWSGEGITAAAENRRGRGYRVSVPAASQLELPRSPGGLLLVPMGDYEITLDAEIWKSRLGDFRFFEQDSPGELINRGSNIADLLVFVAC